MELIFFFAILSVVFFTWSLLMCSWLIQRSKLESERFQTYLMTLVSERKAMISASVAQQQQKKSRDIKTGGNGQRSKDMETLAKQAEVWDEIERSGEITDAQMEILNKKV